MGSKENLFFELKRETLKNANAKLQSHLTGTEEERESSLKALKDRVYKIQDLQMKAADAICEEFFKVGATAFKIESFLKRKQEIIGSNNEEFLLNGLLEGLKKEKENFSPSSIHSLGFYHYLHNGLEWDKFNLTVYGLMLKAAAHCDSDQVEHTIRSGDNPLWITEFRNKFDEIIEGFFNAYMQNSLVERLNEFSAKMISANEQFVVSHIAVIIGVLEIDLHLKTRFDLSGHQASKLLVDLCKIKPTSDTARTLEKALSDYPNENSKTLTKAAFDSALAFFEKHKLAESIRTLNSLNKTK